MRIVKNYLFGILRLIVNILLVLKNNIYTNNEYSTKKYIYPKMKLQMKLN